MSTALFLFSVLLLWITAANFFTIRRPAAATQITTSISVLIPVRNEAENVAELIDCLTKQTHLGSLEIIFIDDSSEDGTGKNMQIPGYRVGGKTGTANRYDENTGGYSGYTSSFIGMAPAEKPALVMSVSIHNPKTSTYGSVVAGPVFKKVMTYALAHRKIPPSTTKPPKLPVEW